MDLKNWSDKDLEALAEGNYQKLSDEALHTLASTPLPKEEPKEQKNHETEIDTQAMQTAGVSPLQHFPQADELVRKGLEYIGNQYDSYISSPMRAAHGAHQRGESMTDAYMNQVGQDPELAPKGSQLASGMGFSNEGLGKTNISPADIAGVGLNIIEDPLILTGPAFKMAKTMAKAGVSLGGKAIGTGIRGVDALMGTEKGSQLVNKISNSAAFTRDSISNALEGASEFFKPNQAEDFQEMANIGKRYKIDPKDLPESVEFGKGTFLDSAGRSLRESPLRDQYMKKYLSSYEKLSKGVLDEIHEISGGSPAYPLEAGLNLRKSFDEGLERFWNGIDLTHDEIQKYAPGLFIDRDAMDHLNSTVNGIEKFARGRVARGISADARQQGSELLNAVEAFRAGNGSYKQSVEALREIGQEAFQTSNRYGKVPPDIKNLRKLYFSINDALIDTVRKHVNPDFANELIENNKAIHQMYNDKNQLGYILGDKDIAPENAWRRVIANGDSDQIKALEKFLTPEQMNYQKGAFLHDLIKFEPDGSFSIKNLYNTLRSKRDRVQNLFQENTEPFIRLTQALRLGDRFGNAVLSTSGTGASNIFHHLYNSMKSSVLNESVINSLKQDARLRAPTENPTSIMKFEKPSIGKFPLGPAKGAQIYTTTGQSASPVERKLKKLKGE